MTKSLLLLLQLLSLLRFGHFAYYPWGEQDYDTRQEELLHLLRHSIYLDSSDPIIVDTVQKAAESGLRVSDETGEPWVAYIMQDSDKEDEKDNPKDDIYNSETLQSKFDGICALLPNEYWNYEWCHRKSVRQFHLEQREHHWHKSPDFSLGEYKRTLIVRDLNAVPSPVVKIVDFFEGGQICDENKQQRSTEVHITCCDLSVHDTASVYTTGHNTKFLKASLQSIREPSICSYVATVCSPLLCQKSKKNAHNKSGARKGSKSGRGKDTTTDGAVTATNKNKQEVYVKAMQLLLNMCLIRQEEWWTYELCFGKSMRQIRFNIEQATTADGMIVQKQVAVNQYLLGLAPTDIYSNESALIEHTKFKGGEVDANSLSSSFIDNAIIWSMGMVSPLFKAKEEEVNSLKLEFTDGTPCDLDKVNRSTVVEMYCGKANSLVSIREDSTCKYRVRAELALLCTLPRFSPQLPNITRIGFTSLSDWESNILSKRGQDKDKTPAWPGDAVDEMTENSLVQSTPDIVDLLVDKNISEVGLDSDEYAALAGNEIMQGIHKLQDDEEESSVELDNKELEHTEVAVEEAVGHLDLPPAQKAALKAEILSMHREAQRGKKSPESVQKELEQQQFQVEQRQHSEVIVTELEAKLSQIKAREEAEEQARAKHAKMTKNDKTLLRSKPPSPIKDRKADIQQETVVKNEAEKVLEEQQKKQAEQEVEEEEKGTKIANNSDEL